MKKKQIKKLKSERKKGNLMAMLKTVKRRKADDVLAEALTELEQIEKKVESEPIPEDMLTEDGSTEHTIISSSDKPRRQLEIPMAKALKKRINNERFAQWD